MRGNLEIREVEGASFAHGRNWKWDGADGCLFWLQGLGYDCSGDPIMIVLTERAMLLSSKSCKKPATQTKHRATATSS